MDNHWKLDNSLSSSSSSTHVTVIIESLLNARQGQLRGHKSGQKGPIFIDLQIIRYKEFQSEVV